MRVLILGINPEILPAGCRITQDPGEAEAAVCAPGYIDACPAEIPVYVIKENSMKDFLARQKRPDALFVSADELPLLLEEPEIEEPVFTSSSLLLASYANKGGVGKTTAILSLAFALSNRDKRTVLCDLDFGAPDLAGFFNITSKYGLESAGRVPLRDMLVKVRNNLYLLPGVSGTTEPDPDELLQTINDLKTRFDAVLIDTPPAPWEKQIMHRIFPQCDVVYAVVDQSKFSMQETAKYAPTLLAMGVDPNRIRLVINRYNPKLTSIKEIQKSFVSGFRRGIKYTPKVAVIMPEGWEDHVKALAKGRIVSGSEWDNAVKELFGEEEKKPRRKLFLLF